MIPVCERPDLTTDFQRWIFIKEKFLPAEICDDLIKYAEDKFQVIPNKVWKSSFMTCGLPKDHYIHNELSALWDEAIDFYKTKIDFIEEYTINKYKFGDYFHTHVDNYKGLTSKLDRKLTFSLQLCDSNDYGAGDFLVQGYNMPKTKGSVIIFPSTFEHSISRVGYGTRYSLFTWAWGETYL